MAKGDQLSIGSDYTLTLPLLNDDGTVMNLTTVQGIAVSLVQGKNKVIKRYSLHNIGNAYTYGKLSILSAAGGTLKLVVDREVTALCTEGVLYYRAEVQLENEDFTDDHSNNESAVGIVGDMITGTSKRLDLSA